MVLCRCIGGMYDWRFCSHSQGGGIDPWEVDFVDSLFLGIRVHKRGTRNVRQGE